MKKTGIRPASVKLIALPYLCIMQNTHFRSINPTRNRSSEGLFAPLKVVFPSVTLKLRHPSPPTPQKLSIRSHSIVKRPSPSKSPPPRLYIPTTTGKSVPTKEYDFALGQVKVLGRGRRSGVLLEQYGRGFELMRKLSGQNRKKSSSESSESSVDCERAKSVLGRKHSSLSVESKTPKLKRSKHLLTAHHKHEPARKGLQGYLSPVKFTAKPLDNVNDVHQFLYHPRKPSLRLA